MIDFGQQIRGLEHGNEGEDDGMERRGLSRREFARYSVIIGLISVAALFHGAKIFAEQPKDVGRKIGFLEVPGARLYYETIGSGPLMIMVPGANGDAKIFKWVSEQLAPHYTVITYDRRGFSRSRLTGPQDYERRIETDADDVLRLIAHMGDQPAVVFGSSSGGVIALEVLAHYPSVVRTLVPHEPAAVKQLPDGQKWIDFFFSLYDLYRQSGAELAVSKFREQAFAESDRQVMARAPKSEYTLPNAQYWFEHELRQYPAVDLDIDALKTHANRIVLMVGRESRGTPCYNVNVELGKKLNRDVFEMPGGHSGFASQPDGFAQEFLQILSRTGR